MAIVMQEKSLKYKNVEPRLSTRKILCLQLEIELRYHEKDSMQANVELCIIRVLLGLSRENIKPLTI